MSRAGKTGQKKYIKEKIRKTPSSISSLKRSVIIRALLLGAATPDNVIIFRAEKHDGMKVIFWETCDVKFPTAVRDKWS